MRLRLPRVLPLGVLAVALTALGCKPPPSKRTFNNTIAKELAKVSQTAFTIHAALFGTVSSKEIVIAKINQAAVRAAVDAMSEAVKKAEAGVEDMELPRLSSSASNLKAAYVKYLSQQKAIVEKAQEIVAVLEDPNGKFPTDADKLERITKLLEEIADLEKPAFKQVEDAQKAYCDAHFYKLVDKLN